MPHDSRAQLIHAYHPTAPHKTGRRAGWAGEKICFRLQEPKSCPSKTHMNSKFFQNHLTYKTSFKKLRKTLWTRSNMLCLTCFYKTLSRQHERMLIDHVIHNVCTNHSTSVNIRHRTTTLQAITLFMFVAQHSRVRGMFKAGRTHGVSHGST